MSNEKEITHEVLKVAKQNQTIFNELVRLLNSQGFQTARLETHISRNASNIAKLEKLVLGEEYGKPSNLPGL